MNPEFQKNIDRIDTLNETKLQEKCKYYEIGGTFCWCCSGIYKRDLS